MGLNCFRLLMSMMFVMVCVTGCHVLRSFFFQNAHLRYRHGLGGICMRW